MEETGRVPTVQEKNRKVYKSNSRLDSRIKYNGQELNLENWFEEDLDYEP